MPSNMELSGLTAKLLEERRFDRRFAVVYAALWHHEGGWAVDHAGQTNYGITLTNLRRVGDLDGDGFAEFDLDRDGDVDAVDLRAMTPVDAAAYFQSQWYERHRFYLIEDIHVMFKALTFSVNMGPRPGQKVIQRALWSLGERVTVDGWIGPLTRAAMRGKRTETFLAAIRSEAWSQYRAIIAVDEAKFERFENGWRNRAYDFEDSEIIEANLRLLETAPRAA